MKKRTNNRVIIVVFLSILVLSCSGLSTKEESYHNNNLSVYVRIEGRRVDEMSDNSLIQELEKKARNRALGLMIIVIEDRIADHIYKEKIISNLRSFEMKSELLSFTVNDYYCDGYFKFKTKGFEESLIDYERKNNIK
ncbi:MAG: hypothetical protein JXK07_13565 [Spirochaetes bacterium]|nr:hypothetical protein [Spirochaetota bacterium]MBN2770046.1 hypothetical protein [Spirochaetota bacterium]